MKSFFTVLFNKAKPYICIYVIIQIILTIIIIILFNKDNSFKLLKDIGSLAACNLFALFGLEFQMLLLFFFSKTIILEIYSTLLTLSSFSLVFVFFSNESSLEDILVMTSIVVTLCISGLFNRIVLSKMKIKEYQRNKIQ